MRAQQRKRKPDSRSSLVNLRSTYRLDGDEPGEQWQSADGGTGETDDLERAHAGERRQDAGGATVGHWKDDTVSQVERVRVPKLGCRARRWCRNGRLSVGPSA